MKPFDNLFDTVYPFATENVYGYFDRLDLNGKDVLTVGSSLDQLFNAVVLGANKITVLDINPYVEKYFLDKMKILLQSSREDFYNNIMSFHGNDYCFSKDCLSREQIYRCNLYLHNNDKEALKNYTKVLYAQARLIEGLTIEAVDKCCTFISHLICDTYCDFAIVRVRNSIEYNLPLLHTRDFYVKELT